jgi:hypothetical protein
MLTPARSVSRNVVKLIVISLLFFSFLIGLPVVWRTYLLPLPWYFGWAIGLLPLISLLFCLAKNGGFRDLGGTITGVKYYFRFPLFFYHDPEPPQNVRFNKVEEIARIIQPGDVLLRRHDHYIDGLILSQTTYFTHAGIFYGTVDGKENQVIHAIGSKGVSWIDLDEFARCDDIALLRFEIDPKLQQEEVRKPTRTSMSFLAENKLAAFKMPEFIFEPEGKGSVLNNKIVFNFDVRTFIEDVAEDGCPAIRLIGSRELALYDSLKNDLSTDGKLAVIPNRNEYIALILEMAEALLGKQYDFQFNFIDFKRLSCVEFVWYCYKSLFPLHQIRRRFFIYFNCVKTFVLVPDQFLKTRFFKLHFSSVHLDNKKGRQDKRLSSFVKLRLLHFWSFFGKMMLCQFLLLLISWILFSLFYRGGVFFPPAK